MSGLPGSSLESRKSEIIGMGTKRPVRIGTRGSRLAILQAQTVLSCLKAVQPRLEITIVPIRTMGDRLLQSPLTSLGGKGVFVKEIEEALIMGQVDMAVHSMKDLPTELAPGLIIGAVPSREDPLDVLVCRTGIRLMELSPGSKVATSSLRRKAQILHLRPDLMVVDIRGNVDTRIRKLTRGDQGIEALILAAAAIRRMGLWEVVTEILPQEQFVPAAGQGALAVEVREDDIEIRELVALINDPLSAMCVKAERAFLKALGGGCQVPAGALAKASGEVMEIQGMVAGPEGTPFYWGKVSGPTADPEATGRKLARFLLDKGGSFVLQNIHHDLPAL